MTAGGTIKAVLALTVAAMTPLAAGAREELRRCEDAAGHVTYSNEACPTGTSRERTVENRPAVEVRRDGAGDNAAGHGGAIVPSARAAASRDPASVKEMDQEKHRALVARCDDLVHRIEYGQQDLLTAAPGERASVELGIRRLQQEHASVCAPPVTEQP